MHLDVTGTTGASTQTNASGNYILTLQTGGDYLVTPSHPAVPIASAGIDTLDVIAVQRHFLQIALLTGCALTAADVDENGVVNIADLVAIQRFFAAHPSGTANVGQYRFMPVNRDYPLLVIDQVNQDYGAIILGDVVGPFVHHPGVSPAEGQ